MKSFRVMGSVFIVLGFFFALIGILSSLVPMIENEQFTLIISSFQETSPDALTNTLNSIVRFCLHSSYFLLLCGISLMVTGGLISSTARRKQNEETNNEVTNRAAATAAPNAGIPQPAYYPGGMQPSASGFSSEPQSSQSYTLRTEPMDKRIASVQKPTPITGSIAAALSTEESDAQKLMFQDRQRVSRVAEEKPSGGNPVRYLSNTAADLENGAVNAAGNSAAKAPDAPLSAPANKPRIVSTIGKKPRQ